VKGGKSLNDRQDDKDFVKGQKSLLAAILDFQVLFQVGGV
jgi:hypothetical protein